jgi:hypothetical protein
MSIIRDPEKDLKRTRIFFYIAIALILLLVILSLISLLRSSRGRKKRSEPLDSLLLLLPGDSSRLPALKAPTAFRVLSNSPPEFTLAAPMNPKRTAQSVEDRWLTIEEVRIVSDLRVMHAKVDELFHLVSALKRRHDEAAVVKYADQPVLTEDIQKVDEIYLWFVRLKEASIAARQ